MSRTYIKAEADSGRLWLVDSKSKFVRQLQKGYGFAHYSDNVSKKSELGDSFCSICDDGGFIICCDGPCLRSFHATVEDALQSNSLCASLKLDMEVKNLPKFLCRNCEMKQHQCHICGELGASDGASKKVFRCKHSSCGRFYHLKCMSEFVDKRVGAEFSCPSHVCDKCEEGEERGEEEESMRLYVCRRCPRAWHKQCISDKIVFRDLSEGNADERMSVRGWKNGESRFLYCLDHQFAPGQRTPPCDHLKFP